MNIRWTYVKLLYFFKKGGYWNCQFQFVRRTDLWATFPDFINIIDHHNVCKKKKKSWQFMKRPIFGSSNTQMQ
jgi:hypothetical protein